jgi:hypothetical protein
MFAKNDTRVYEELQAKGSFRLLALVGSEFSSQVGITQLFLSEEDGLVAFPERVSLIPKPGR